MLTRLLHLIRNNVIALIALFVALGGTSYAALNLPAELRWDPAAQEPTRSPRTS